MTSSQTEVLQPTMICWIATIFCLVCLPGPSAAFTTADEARLRGDLANNQSVDVRPDAQTIISLSFQLTSVSAVDIKQQMFGITGWWSMRWSDVRLSWDPSSYANIPVLQLNSDKLWTPTLVVDNSLDDLSAIDEDTIPTRVDASGVVTWNPPGLISVSCEMDITYFPFEEQTCSVQVTSFGYTIQELSVIIHSRGFVLTYFSPNGEWDLLETWTDRDTFFEDGYEYSRVYFYLRVKRKPLYYGLNMILPVLINACLTIFVFVLPAESGEKIGYCLTVLLSFMVILTLIATDLPTTAKYTSILEIYIAMVLIMGGLSVIFSIINLNIFFRPDEEKIPKFIRKATRVGMYISCFNTCCKIKVKPEEIPDPGRDRGSRHKYNANGVDSGMHLRTTPFLAPSDHFYPRGTKRLEDPLDTSNTPVRTSSPDSLLYKPLWLRQGTDVGWRPSTAKGTSRPGDARGGQGSRQHFKHKDKSDKPEVTWQLVARVIDAVLFRVYLLFLLVSSVIILTMLMS